MATFIYGSVIVAKNNDSQNPGTSKFTGTGSSTPAATNGGLEATAEGKAFTDSNTNTLTASIDSLRCKCDEGQVWSNIQRACIENPCDLEFEVFNEETENCDPINGLCVYWENCERTCGSSSKQDCLTKDGGSFYEGLDSRKCADLLAIPTFTTPTGCKKCYYCTGPGTYSYKHIDNLEFEDGANDCEKLYFEGEYTRYYNEIPQGCKACYGCDNLQFIAAYAKQCADIPYPVVDADTNPGDKRCCQGTTHIVQGRYNADGHRVCCQDEKCFNQECTCPALYHGFNAFNDCIELSIDISNFNEDLNYWTRRGVKNIQPGPCPVGAWCLDTDSQPENFESLSGGGGGSISPCPDREAACSEGNYGDYIQSGAPNQNIAFVENGTCQDFPSTTTERIWGNPLIGRETEIFEVQRSRFPIACCLTPTPTPTPSMTPSITPTSSSTPTSTPTATTSECSGSCTSQWMLANFDGGYSWRVITGSNCSSGCSCNGSWPDAGPQPDNMGEVPYYGTIFSSPCSPTTTPTPTSSVTPSSSYTVPSGQWYKELP
jgi:hypothetical protein